jgi:hypothetical protein
MPQILIVTDSPNHITSTVVYRERVDHSDLESNHFSGQLVERVGWAVDDAEALERRSRLRRGDGHREDPAHTEFKRVSAH